MEKHRFSQCFVAMAVLVTGTVYAQVDPGVRPGGAGAGNPLAGLSPNELVFFDAGRDDFAEAEGVGDGLGLPLAALGGWLFTAGESAGSDGDCVWRAQHVAVVHHVERAGA